MPHIITTEQGIITGCIPHCARCGTFNVESEECRDTWRGFFRMFGRDHVLPSTTRVSPLFTVEEMYQMFKARLCEETQSPTAPEPKP